MDIGEAALSGMAGAGEGFSQGVQNAASIKQMQALGQQQAIQGFAFKKMQEEEERLNKPIYKDDIVKKIPAEFQGAFFNSTSDKWQKGADGREFMPTRDMTQYKETLGNFDKHQMMTSAIQFLAKEDEQLNPKFQKNTATLKDLMQEFQTKSAALKEKGETSKLLKLQSEWKERLASGDIGELVKETQGMGKKLYENRQKRGMYQAKINGAEDSVKKIMEAHPGLDPNQIMAAWGGDKEAQDAIQAIVAQDKARAAGTTSFQEKGVTERGGNTVSYDPKNARNFVTKPDGVVEPYDPKKHGKIISTAMPQGIIYKEGKDDKAPSGYRYTKGGDLEAIPGGPADVKRQQQEQKTAAAIDGVSSDLDRLALVANQLKNHPGLNGITGIRGAIPNIPGSQSANAEALLETLKSQTAFSVLQTMRNNSKTGGALGQVSDKEGQLLQNNLAALSKAQSADAYRAALQNIIDYTEKSKTRIQRVRDIPACAMSFSWTAGGY